MASIIFLAIVIFIFEILKTFLRIKKFKSNIAKKPPQNVSNESHLVPTITDIKEPKSDASNILEPVANSSITSKPHLVRNEEIENLTYDELLVRRQNDEAERTLLISSGAKANLEDKGTQINLIANLEIQKNTKRKGNCRLSQKQNYTERSIKLSSRNKSSLEVDKGCHNLESYSDGWDTFHFQCSSNRYPLYKNDTLNSRNFSISQSESAYETFDSDESSADSIYNEETRRTRKLGRRGDGFSFIVCDT